LPKRTRVTSLTSFFFKKKKRVKGGTRKLENKIKELVSIFIQIQVLKAKPTGLTKPRLLYLIFNLWHKLDSVLWQWFLLCGRRRRRRHSSSNTRRGLREEEGNVDTKTMFVFWGRTSCDNKVQEKPQKEVFSVECFFR
jgi:hypothetical protein